ncbi:MAG: hypothetical protein NC177_14230 [Ruminococcus flavefaciens]|nr:hypothetical protein [Ruminococcus flavefaciens]
MKITLNLNELYRLMRERKIETVRQLSCESGVIEATLYGGIRRKNLSKEAYWKLAKFFDCHIEDLQIAVEREEFCEKLRGNQEKSVHKST